MVFFCLMTTDWIFDISLLCWNSTEKKQSIVSWALWPFLGGDYHSDLNVYVNVYHN